MSWSTIPVVGGDIHVVPEGDLRPHQQLACWCRPTPMGDDDMVIVHHSMDGREQHEAGKPLH